MTPSGITPLFAWSPCAGRDIDSLAPSSRVKPSGRSAELTSSPTVGAPWSNCWSSLLGTVPSTVGFGMVPSRLASVSLAAAVPALSVGASSVVGSGEVPLTLVSVALAGHWLVPLSVVTPAVGSGKVPSGLASVSLAVAVPASSVGASSVVGSGKLPLALAPIAFAGFWLMFLSVVTPAVESGNFSSESLSGSWSGFTVGSDIGVTVLSAPSPVAVSVPSGAAWEDGSAFTDLPASALVSVSSLVGCWLLFGWSPWSARSIVGWPVVGFVCCWSLACVALVGSGRAEASPVKPSTIFW